MTVDRLGDNRVLIVLCTKDMEDFRLDYKTLSLNDIHCRKILMRIMQLACRKSGIETNGRSVKLETIYLEGGCYILITVDEKHRTRTYKIKNPRECRCYSLGNGTNFLNAIEQLYRQNVCCNKNRAFVYDDKYYLIFDYPSIPRRLRIILSEFGRKVGSNADAARVTENGRELCSSNAIAQIGQYLV